MHPTFRITAILTPAVLLVACGSDSAPVGFELQANRFATSGWSNPVNLGSVVNSSGLDANAGLSPNELALYFVSNRPGGLGDNDIWVSERRCIGCPWEPPVNLGAPINTPAGEGAPTLSTDGRRLFFFSGRPGGQGNFDIYVSHRTGRNADGDTWGAPVNLGPDVNTSGPEQGSYYTREGGGPTAVLYFNRVPTGGTLDIHRVAVNEDGVPLGPAVAVAELNNPAAADQKVTVRTDGLELLLSSTRAGSLGAFDLWVSTRETPKDPWSTPAHLDAPLNTTGIDSQPNLSRDGRTLIFTSSRTGGHGANDLWMSTRAPGR